MSDSEDIKVGEHKIGLNTTITFTVKTLFYFFGILFTFLTTLFGWFYFKTIEREEGLKSSIESNLTKFKEDMKDEIIPIRNQIFELAKGQGEIKTDIKTVINKQLELPVMNNPDNNNNVNSPTGPHQ